MIEAVPIHCNINFEASLAGGRFPVAAPGPDKFCQPAEDLPAASDLIHKFPVLAASEAR